MKEGREIKEQKRLSAPSERLLSEEGLREASYPCPDCNCGLHSGYWAYMHAGAAQHSWHLLEEGLSRQTQLLLSALTCLPRALGTQMIPHDLGFFFLKHYYKTRTWKDYYLVPVLSSLEIGPQIFRNADSLFTYRPGWECASSLSFLN